MLHSLVTSRDPFSGQVVRSNGTRLCVGFVSRTTSHVTSCVTRAAIHSFRRVRKLPVVGIRRAFFALGIKLVSLVHSRPNIDSHAVGRIVTRALRVRDCVTWPLPTTSLPSIDFTSDSTQEKRPGRFHLIGTSNRKVATVTNSNVRRLLPKVSLAYHRNQQRRRTRHTVLHRRAGQRVPSMFAVDRRRQELVTFIYTDSLSFSGPLPPGCIKNGRLTIVHVHGDRYTLPRIQRVVRPRRVRRSIKRAKM